MSRTRIGSVLVLLAIVLLLIAALPTAVLAESTPMLAWGTVTLNGGQAPWGTKVDIYVGADTTPSGSGTVTVPGQYGAIQVWADSSRYGETLTYKVNGFVANKLGPGTGIFGLNNQVVNLAAISGTSPTPTLTPIPTLPPSNAPDFVVWDIWTAPVELCTGGSVCIYTIIENIGTVDAVDIFRTNIYLDGILIEKIDIHGLPTGIRKTLTCEYTILWPSDTDWQGAFRSSSLRTCPYTDAHTYTNYYTYTYTYTDYYSYSHTYTNYYSYSHTNNNSYTHADAHTNPHSTPIPG